MKLKRALCIVLCLVLVVVIGCSKNDGGKDANEPNPTMTSDTPKDDGSASKDTEKAAFPIVEKPIKLEFFTANSPLNLSPWNDIMLWQEYQKMTNMEIDFQLVANADLVDRRNIVLASGEYPDAFYGADFPAADIMKYGGQGVFVNLNEIIEKEMPNLTKLLDATPAIRKAITMPDGNIYSLPWILDPEFKSLLMGTRLWINKTWVDKLGMKEPETLDDLYNYFKAIKDNDVNGNGDVNDEIPLGIIGIQSLVQRLKGSYGLMNKGNYHPYVDVNPDKNELRFIPLEPKYKEMLMYANKLYAEGLIKEDIFTLTGAELYANIGNNLYGAAYLGDPTTLQPKGQYYIGANALEGPHGDKLFVNYNPSVPALANFVITDKNKYPEETARWVDYFYGPEGARMLLLGFEGVTYTLNADGSFDLTDEIDKNPEGLNLSQAISKYTTSKGGGYPGILGIANWPLPAEEYHKSADRVEPYAIKEIWPTFTYLPEESEEFSSLSFDIKTLIDQIESGFIRGDIPFSQWDSYMKKFNDVGLDKYLEIYNNAYQRYLNN